MVDEEGRGGEGDSEGRETGEGKGERERSTRGERGMSRRHKPYKCCRNPIPLNPKP